MIVAVTKYNIADAAKVHALSWQDSHREFCSPEFIAAHTVQQQEAYLNHELEQGKKVYLLLEDKPVGIVSVWNDLIENLYILPEKQHRGYGTKLLRFALEQCDGAPSLWILENNCRAFRLYTKYGFQKTGKAHVLSETISEIEMKRMREFQ